MKKELFFICTAAMLGTVCFANLTADKASAKTSGDYQYVVTGKKKKTCAIRKYLGKDKDVVVPEKIDGYKVTRIGNRAFKGNGKIKSVKLSKYISIIGESAFYDCWNLEDITFPKKVHTIKNKAFSKCNLKNTGLPEKLNTIGKEAFSNCPLEEINIPQYVKKIGKDAFRTYDEDSELHNYITSITVDEKNKTFDSRNNSNCLIETSSNKLILGTNNSTIPDNITAIGDSAFSYCNKLEQISIPSTVKTIGNYAFIDCDKLKEITIPGSVKKIAGGAFADCDLLEKINFSEGLISIEYGAFNGCDSLKEARLPDSLETIGDKAFFCDGLESIHIPKNMKKGYDMSYRFSMESLKTITVAEGNPYYDSRDNCNAVIETSTNTLIMGSNNTTFPDSVTTIGDSAFLGAGIKEITIPSTVTKIEVSAFSNCTSLETINFSEGLKSIGERAFLNCASLKDLRLPDSVETIGNLAFHYCKNLKSIYIPKNLNKTDLIEVFSDISDNGSLEKISVAEGNPYYDSRNNCNAVIETASNTLVLACKNTVIPNTVKVIGKYSFVNTPSELVIPEGVEEISDSAFNGEDKLEKITLPSSLKSIEFNPFGESLKTINYRGSKAQWKKIKKNVMEYDNWLSDVKINYNYKG